ncbi:MAG TPA: hypothetical protein VF230_10045 [Acidimicrobiales bacterium]
MRRPSHAVLVLLAAVVAQLAIESPPVSSAAADLKVGVFGDSFSAGEGLPSVDPGEQGCQRALGRDGQSTAWGVQVARGWGAEPAWFAACTGAKTFNFDEESQKDRPKTQLREAVDGSRVDVFDAITASFGGNDIGFKDTIYDCLGIDIDDAVSAAQWTKGGWLALPGYTSGAFARCSVGTTRLRTPHDVQVGSPEATLSGVEGTRHERPNHYDERNTEIRFFQDGIGYQFGVRDGVVRYWAVGTPDALELVEGCA